jgi:hypothetical protein
LPIGIYKQVGQFVVCAFGGRWGRDHVIVKQPAIYIVKTIFVKGWWRGWFQQRKIRRRSWTRGSRVIISVWLRRKIPIGWGGKVAERVGDGRIIVALWVGRKIPIGRGGKVAERVGGGRIVVVLWVGRKIPIGRGEKVCDRLFQVGSGRRFWQGAAGRSGRLRLLGR